MCPRVVETRYLPSSIQVLFFFFFSFLRKSFADALPTPWLAISLGHYSGLHVIVGILFRGKCWCNDRITAPTLYRIYSFILGLITFVDLTAEIVPLRITYYRFFGEGRCETFQRSSLKDVTSDRRLRYGRAPMSNDEDQ